MLRVRRVALIQKRRAAERLEHDIREELLADDASQEELDAVDIPLFKQFAARFLVRLYHQKRGAIAR